MDFKNIASAALGGKADMPLSAKSQGTLQELITKGVFKDKAQFAEFAMKAFMEYKMKGSSPEALTEHRQNLAHGQWRQRIPTSKTSCCH